MLSTTPTSGAQETEGTIEGTVLEALGLRPTSDTCADVVDDIGTAVVTALVSDGTYSAPGLSPGSYRVFFWDCSGQGRYIAEWYDQASAESQAQVITVEGGATVTGIDAALTPILPAGGRFFDDDGSTHEENIEAIAARGVTLGCNPQQTGYCPGDTVSRGQMASFLARALDLPASTTDHFTDDNTNAHQANINAVADAAITLGCGGTNYCPDDPVNRGQMASFLARALDLPASTTDHFTDDNTNAHQANINAVADAAITLGCGGTNYCPDDPVSRGQMASFLARGFAYDIADVPPRPVTFEGVHLAVVERAAAAGCDSTITGRVQECAITVEPGGPFFLDSGFAYFGWSQFPTDMQQALQSDQVRMEATFDGVEIDLFEWPFIVIEDVGLREWSFQFPAWLTGTHELVVRFYDETEEPDFRSTVNVTITGLEGGGYPGYPLSAQPLSEPQPEQPAHDQMRFMRSAGR